MVILVVEFYMHRMLIVILHIIYILYSEFIISPQSIADNIATLKNVKVFIEGVDNNIETLNDSGSQINSIHISIIPEYKMQTVGRISIRGAFGAVLSILLYPIIVRSI